MAPKDKSQAAFEQHAPDEDYDEAGKGPPAETFDGEEVQGDLKPTMPPAADDEPTVV